MGESIRHGFEIYNLELPNGLFVQRAYVRIDTISLNIEKATLDVKYYTSVAASDDGGPFINQRRFDFRHVVDNDSSHIYKQGYEHLKSLPEFEGAKDIK